MVGFADEPPCPGQGKRTNRSYAWLMAKRGYRQSTVGAVERNQSPKTFGRSLMGKEYHGGHRLTILFRVSDPEQLEAIHHWRAAFQGAAEIEPLDEDRVWALHISPAAALDSWEAA